MTTSKIKGSQQGFTLIELIVVIIVLGILAAVAVPKYLGVTRDARIAALNGVSGGLRSAANIVNAKSKLYLPASCSGSPSACTLTDTSVTPNATYAVVAGANAGDYWPAAATIPSIFDGSGLTNSGAASGAITYYPSGSNSNANCSVTYTQPTAAGSDYTVTISSSGC